MVFETYVLSSGLSLTTDTVKVFCKNFLYKTRTQLANFLLAATGGKPQPQDAVAPPADEEDLYGYTLDAADIAHKFFQSKNWQDWQVDEAYALSRPPRKPTIYEAWEKEYLEKLGIKQDTSKRGYYKFNEHGDCITLEGENVWTTMVYELNELLRLEPAENPVTPTEKLSGVA